MADYFLPGRRPPDALTHQAATAFLRGTLLPLFDKAGWPISRVLTDGGKRLATSLAWRSESRPTGTLVTMLRPHRIDRTDGRGCCVGGRDNTSLHRLCTLPQVCHGVHRLTAADGKGAPESVNFIAARQ